MPNISNSEYNALIRDRKRLDELLAQKEMEGFVHEFTTALGTMAAHTPKCDWPDEFLSAFKHAAHKHQYGAILYTSRLPEPKDDIPFG